MDKILNCDYSSESFLAVLSWGALYYTVQRGSANVTFKCVARIPNVTMPVKPTVWGFPVLLFVTL